MTRPGVLINANARRARRDPGLVDRLRRLVPPERVCATRGADEIVPALSALVEQGVDALVVVGGDGTLPHTLTPQTLGVDVAPRFTTLSVAEPQKRKGGAKVATVQELVAKLRDEAKVIA